MNSELFEFQTLRNEIFSSEQIHQNYVDFDGGSEFWNTKPRLEASEEKDGTRFIIRSFE
jgi:hypothetical protein